MALLITFDGPKGVGKTTLIHIVDQRLREAGHCIEVLVEKELMAAALGTSLDEAYQALKRTPGEASDAEVARLHRKGRVLIGERQLSASKADVVLLDRWYPSDVVFRRHIDVEEAIEANLRDGVRIADIAFAVVCRAEVSWERANQRVRRLDSKVIDSFDDHRVSTERFERLASDYGWHLLRSDSASADELSRQVIDAIQAKFSF